jgi:hypothetical protein
MLVQNSTTREYTTKLGYEAIAEASFFGDKKCGGLSYGSSMHPLK